MSPLISSVLLAAELSGGNVDLPSFPEIAVRVRRVLSDPKSSVDQVVRVVGSGAGPGAARLLPDFELLHRSIAAAGR